MKLRVTISRAIFAFGLITITGLAAVIAASNYGLMQLKVGGPVYDRIKLGNDLVADILPPPAYVIEAYLETTLALQDPSSLAARRAKLVQLKKDYDDRREFWSNSALDPAIRTKLVEQSHAEVQRFWTAVERSFLPALEKGDTVAAAKSYAEIASVYAAHRALIDEIVKLTTADNAATESYAMARVLSLSLIMWCISGFVLMIIAGGIAGVAFGVVKPVVRMTEAMRRIAGGELESEIPSLDRKDEVGEMAKAVQVFRENALQVLALEADQTLSAQKSLDDRKAALQQIADGLENAVGRIVKTVSSTSAEIEAAVGSLARTAETTQQLSATVAAASEQSSSNVQSAAAASEEMASSVTEISRQVQLSQKISQEAVAQAQRTNTQISELSQSAGRIGEVIKMITAVAEQTNLLALNATIEAARAGEAGRGFAVVASEVKALSAQTAKAAEEIATQIPQMQASTQQTVSSINDIGSTIGQISEISSAIAASVDEQDAATREIARNVQQAAQGATEVTGSMVDVSRGAADTGAAAEQVHELTGSLLAGTNDLSREVENFLRTIRAA